MKVYNNNVQSFLDNFAISQVELADISDLSINTINRTCRRINQPREISKAAILDAINIILKDKHVKKKITIEDLFP